MEGKGNMKKLSDKARIYARSYGQQPYGREIEGTAELLLQMAEKLDEYEGLEEQGKLPKLPVAVGDKIYLPNKYVGKVIDFEIIKICIFKEEIMFIDDLEDEYFIDDFGKSVFSTYKEAKAALKELERGYSE